MGSKGHLFISIIKSLVRIIAGCLLLWTPFHWVGLLLITAEVFGILEELVDKR